MGIDYDPHIYYGFRLQKVKVNDDHLGYCLPEAYCHDDTHIYGYEVKFRDFKHHRIDSEAAEFGELILKHFNIQCHYYICQSGDFICDRCGSTKISSLTLFKSLKPHLSDEEALKLYNEIYLQLHPDLKALEEEDFDDEEYKKMLARPEEVTREYERSGGYYGGRRVEPPFLKIDPKDETDDEATPLTKKPKNEEDDDDDDDDEEESEEDESE